MRRAGRRRVSLGRGAASVVVNTMKDWDAIARELSSGEDSDAHDDLNVMSVQKNARRVADMVRTHRNTFYRD